MTVLAMYCEQADITVLPNKTIRCDQWIFESAGFWQNMDASQLSQLTQKILIFGFTAVIFWIVLRFILKL